MTDRDTTPAIHKASVASSNYQFAFKTSYKCLFSTVNWVRDWRANICAGVGKPQFSQNFHELILIRIWV